jgi:Protein of unknown function (DUF4232)
MRGSLARVLLVAIAFGCTDSGAGISAALISSTPTGRCSTRQLRVHYDYAFELMAQVTVALAYTNNSTHRCTLSGWPRVKAISDARPAAASIRTGAMWFQPQLRNQSRAPGVPIVTLEPGQSGYSFLAAAGIYPESSRPCPRYTRLFVTPPGNTQRVTLSGWIASHLNRYIPACARPYVSQVLSRSDVFTAIYRH